MWGTKNCTAYSRSDLTRTYCGNVTSLPLQVKFLLINPNIPYTSLQCWGEFVVVGCSDPEIPHTRMSFILWPISPESNSLLKIPTCNSCHLLVSNSINHFLDKLAIFSRASCTLSQSFSSLYGNADPCVIRKSGHLSSSALYQYRWYEWWKILGPKTQPWGTPNNEWPRWWLTIHYDPLLSIM